MLLFMLVSLLLAATVWMLLRRYRKIRLLEKIPGPRALPILGNSLELLSCTHEQLLKKLTEFPKMGDGIVRLYHGIHPYVQLSKAHTIEPVLSSNTFLSKGRDYNLLHGWLGQGLLTSKGDKWRSRRKLLTPSFHFKILEDFVHIFNRQSERLVAKLNKLADGKPFNMFPLNTLCTLDIILETAMGVDLDIQSGSESDYVKAVYGMSELIQTRQFLPWLYNDFMFKISSLGKKQKAHLSVLHEMSLRTIKRRRDERKHAKIDQNETHTTHNNDLEIRRKKHLAFLDLLLDVSENSSKPLTDEEIREEVDTFMFEGHDTTAAGISFTFYHLGRNVEIQEKVYEEIRDVVGDGPITHKDLRDLKLLEACIKESLRICPSVPFVSRLLSEDCTIGGYEVPAGTTAVIMIYNALRDPEQFVDPEKFDPNRFLDPDITSKRHPFAYVPFSAGPRNCIGQKFALMEEKIVVASVLRKFKIEALQTFEELNLMGELILRPATELKIALTQRETY